MPAPLHLTFCSVAYMLLQPRFLSPGCWNAPPPALPWATFCLCVAARVFQVLSNLKRNQRSYLWEKFFIPSKFSPRWFRTCFICVLHLNWGGTDRMMRQLCFMWFFGWCLPRTSFETLTTFTIDCQTPTSDRLLWSDSSDEFTAFHHFPFGSVCHHCRTKFKNTNPGNPCDCEFTACMCDVSGSQYRHVTLCSFRYRRHTAHPVFKYSWIGPKAPLRNGASCDWESVWGRSWNHMFVIAQRNVCWKAETELLPSGPCAANEPMTLSWLPWAPGGMKQACWSSVICQVVLKHQRELSSTNLPPPPPPPPPTCLFYVCKYKYAVKGNNTRDERSKQQYNTFGL